MEVACNKVLGEGAGTFIGVPDESVKYSLRRCHLAVRDKTVYSLLRDLRILHDIAKVPSKLCILIIIGFISWSIFCMIGIRRSCWVYMIYWLT